MTQEIDKSLLIKELQQVLADSYTARNLMVDAKYIIAYQKMQSVLTRTLNILKAVSQPSEPNKEEQICLSNEGNPSDKK